MQISVFQGIGIQTEYTGYTIDIPEHGNNLSYLFIVFRTVNLEDEIDIL